MSLFVICACSGSGLRRTGPDGPTPSCGDGVLDAQEACDGSTRNGASCQALGFDEGTVSCTADCTVATTACVRRCGNGVLDQSEACDGQLGVPACTTFGSVRCTACQLDRNGCVNPGLNRGPVMDNAKGGPASIGDVATRGPHELVMVVPGFSRVELFSWATGVGFDMVGSRKLSFDQQPRRARVADVNADGLGDVLVLNENGSLDAYVFQGTSFTRRQLADAGCVQGDVLAVSDAGVALLCQGEVIAVRGTSVSRQAVDAGVVFSLHLAGASALGWATDELLWQAPLEALDQWQSAPFPGGGVTAIAAADFDADGDVDVVARTAEGLIPIENTGTGWARRPLWPAPMAQGLWAGDVDLDGRPDMVTLVGENLVVRRNEGLWLFSSHFSQAQAGQLVSLAVGDIDGDTDPDFALTFSNGLEATRTATVLNRVR